MLLTIKIGLCDLPATGHPNTGIFHRSLALSCVTHFYRAMAIYLGYVPRQIELELIDKSESLFRIIRLEGVWDESADERAIFPPEAFDKEMDEGDKAKGIIRYNELVGKMLPLENKMCVG